MSSPAPHAVSPFIELHLSACHADHREHDAAKGGKARQQTPAQVELSCRDGSHRRPANNSSRYTIPKRIHCSYAHPRPALDGTTFIVCGTESGLSIFWRGSADSDGIDGGEPVTEAYEEDPECPYPNITQRIDIDLDRAVLRIAAPTLNTHGQIPEILRANALVTVAYTNGALQVFNIPLSSPSTADKPDFIRYVLDNTINLPPVTSPCRALAAKIVAVDDLNPGLVKLDDEAIAILNIAVGSTSLDLHRLAIYEDSIGPIETGSRSTWELPAPTTSLSWHPSSRTLQLLIGDVTGAARIFDPQAVAARSRPSSRDSSMAASSERGSLGKWLFAYFSTYTSAEAGVPRRKQLLDVAWIHSGAGILALLEDGEWGVWDVTGSSVAKGSCTFGIRGYIGSMAGVEANDTRQRRGGSKLAPMTPNTRKVKAEKLFSGPSKTPGLASSGQINVFSRGNPRGTVTDETAWLWYNGDIYGIPSVSTLWQRGINQNSSGASLQSPNLLHAADLDVMNEDITSISQLPWKTGNAASGQASGPGDLLVTTEHRMIIQQSLRVPGPAKVLFQLAMERPVSRDQRMLDAGELDLGGMDRVLDHMSSNGDAARPRKVGFAH